MSGGSAPRHAESIAKPGIDVAAAVHRGEPGRKGVGAGGQVGGLDPAADHPAGQHVESGCHPGDDETAGALAQPDHRGIVEPQRPFDERREIFAVGGVVQPDTAFGLRSSRSSRCKILALALPKAVAVVAP